LPEFIRARRPYQKRERSEAILATAAELLDHHPVGEITLTEIARRSGFSKSNLYRYFESREDIFIQLFLADLMNWVESLEKAMVPLYRCGDPWVVGKAAADSLLDYPRVCELTASLSTVLEQNVSLDIIRSFKHQVALVGIRVGNTLGAALPEIPAEHFQVLFRLMEATLTGIWHSAHPPEVVREALEEPGLEVFRSDFGEDLGLAYGALLAGFLHPSGKKAASEDRGWN